MAEFFGKYRGQVVNNIDPNRLGRVQVRVPAVLGDGRLSWALPCAPYAGSGVGFFAVPPIGANVWVEFEAGNPDAPIWSGCFWGDGEAPVSNPVPFEKVFKTDSLTLKLDDTPGAGGFTLEVAAPAVAVPITISCTSSGIEISTGGARIAMAAAPPSVNINNGALEVM